jgi:RNA polymerase sigma-70 factor (ECF subfamily)
MKSSKYRDAEALKDRIAGLRDRLYRVALAWCGDKMLADDLVQETMKAGIINGAQLRDENRLSAWLYSILHNNWCQHLRKAKPQTELDDQLPSEGLEPLGACQELEVVERVRFAVASLPTDQRQVISLVDLEELSYCEVAQVLNIPIGTVMSRLHRARKQLLAKLDEPTLAPIPSPNRKISQNQIRIVK